MRTTAVLAALLGGLLTACAPRGPSLVVLISVDTLRADRVGLLGAERDTTPHLDAFFGAGSVFESASSSSPCTVPSVRQYLSGALARDPSRPPLAERLGALGFRTAAVVSQHKFHVDQVGAWNRGFDHFDVQGPDEVDAHGLSSRDARQVSDRALALLESLGPDERLFLWLHYFDPHDPYEPPPGHRGFDAGDRSQRSGDRRAEVQAWRRSRPDGGPRVEGLFSDEDVAHLRNLYDGEVHYTDAQIGRVLGALEARGWVERALVVLTADHGEWLGEDGSWDHCLGLHERELHVPLLVRDRGGPLAGRAREPRPVSTLDVAPTLLAAVGAAPPAAVGEGVALQALPDARPVFAFWRSQLVVRRGAWKLLMDGGAVAGLFDVESDPAGVRNQVLARPQLRDSLAAEVRALGEIAERTGLETEQAAEQLRALGYLE